MTKKPERKLYLARIAECDGVVLPLLVMLRECIVPEEIDLPSSRDEHVEFHALARSLLRYDARWCELSMGINAHQEDRLDELCGRYETDPETLWTPWLCSFFGGDHIDIEVVTRGATKAQVAEFRKLKHVFPSVIRLQEAKA